MRVLAAALILISLVDASAEPQRLGGPRRLTPAPAAPASGRATLGRAAAATEVCPGGNVLLEGSVRFASPGCSDGTFDAHAQGQIVCSSGLTDLDGPPTHTATLSACADRPLRRARVEAIQVGFSAPVAVTLTDDDGQFRFCLVNPFPNQGVSLFARIQTCANQAGAQCDDPGNHPVVVRTAANAIYTTNTDRIDGVCTGTIRWDVVDRRPQENGAAAIYDLLANEAFDVLRDEVGFANVSRLQVRFPESPTSIVFPDGSLTIAAGDAQDPDVILNTYAFHVMLQRYGGTIPGACSSQGWTAKTDRQCAWFQAWGKFLQAAMQRDPVFENTPAPGSPDPSPFDLEGPVPTAAGADVEGAVAAALWDLFDASGEAHDDVALGLEPIWAALAARPRDVCAFKAAFPPAVVEPILAHHGISCTPKVINILTHGFNPLGSFSLFDKETTFLPPWRRLAQKLDELPEKGSALDGVVRSYVADWESTEGFLHAFGALFASKVAEAAADAARDQGETALAAARDVYAAQFLEFADAVASGGSATHALDAAKRIVDDVKEEFLLDDPEESRTLPQKIHLIGHSRGAAVNAAVSKMLTAEGYDVDQYTALDGYSTDWPAGGGSIGDISIADEAQAGRRVSFRVDESLGAFIVRSLESLPAGDVLSLAVIAAVVRVTAAMLKEDPEVVGDAIGEITPDIRERLRALDLRAPERVGFDDNPTMESLTAPAPNCLGGSTLGAEKSHHVNVLQLYGCSDELPAVADHLLDNFLGRNRAAAVLPSSAAAALDVAARRSGAALRSAAPPGHDFVDGGFEGVGTRLADAVAANAGSSGVPFVDLWYQIVSSPTAVLAGLWDVVGDVRLVTGGADTVVELTQTDDTSIAQFVLLPDDAPRIELTASVVTAGSGDALEIDVDGAVVAHLDLAGLVDGPQVVDVAAFAGHAGSVRFRLVGPAAAPAVVRLDDLALTTDAPPTSTTTTTASATSSTTVAPVPASTTTTSVAVASSTTSTVTVASSTTTTLPCASVRCSVELGLTHAACAGVAIPKSVTRKLGQAATLVEQAAVKPEKQRKKLLKRARTALKQARTGVVRAAKRKNSKVSPECAAVLKSTADQALARLAT